MSVGRGTSDVLLDGAGWVSFGELRGGGLDFELVATPAGFGLRSISSFGWWPICGMTVGWWFYGQWYFWFARLAPINVG